MNSASQRFASLPVGMACGGLILAFGTAAAQQTAPRPGVELNTLRDLGLAMQLCWLASLPVRAVPGMTIRVMVSFTRSGEMFGEPKFTFLTHGVPTETAAAYQRAAADALARCNPLPFSQGLGNAVAGRPWIFNFIDRRTEKRT